MRTFWKTFFVYRLRLLINFIFLFNSENISFTICTVKYEIFDLRFFRKFDLYFYCFHYLNRSYGRFVLVYFRYWYICYFSDLNANCSTSLSKMTAMMCLMTCDIASSLLDDFWVGSSKSRKSYKKLTFQLFDICIKSWNIGMLKKFL